MNAVAGAIGMNFKETDAIIILSISQPSKLNPAIKSTIKRSESFLFSIRKKDDLAISCIIHLLDN
jgi:hypothetical protein